jgi:hypothetical protein
MHRRIQLLLIVMYLAAAMLPVLWLVSGARRQRVGGTLPLAKLPAPTLASIADERFQHGVTRWFENHRTLFGYAVHLDNTVLYRVFGETRAGARIVLGRDRRILFIDEDIGHLNLREFNIPTPEAVADLAGRIARAQRAMQARGQALVPLIVPAKTSVYRDQVDPRWRRFDGPTPSDVRVYEQMVAELDRAGVLYVDMRAELTSGRHERAAVWGPEARHWSDYGACLALQQVAQRAAGLRGAPPVPYDCRLARVPADWRNADFDLWRLLNVWGVPRSRRVPIAEHAPPPAGIRPLRTLLVGTSFNWNLLFDAERSGVLRPLRLLYYDSRLIDWPGLAGIPMSAGAPGWDAVLAEQDLVVLDLMEAAVFSGHQYLESFLRDVAPPP